MRQERPDDPGVLVSPPHDPGQPTAGMIHLSFRHPDHGACAMDQQGPQVGIAALTDAEQHLFAATGILTRNNPEPGRQLSATLEALGIADRCHQRARRDRPDATQEATPANIAL